jgi:tetratricopeptide (TPR) repeat protein
MKQFLGTILMLTVGSLVYAADPLLLGSIAALVEAGDIQGALAVCDQAAQLDTELQALKASLLLAVGRDAEAKTTAQTITKAEPNNIQALFILATLEHKSAGRTREYSRLLEKIIALDSKHTQALVALGNTALDNHAYQTAASYFDRALALEPDNAQALLGRAGVHRQYEEFFAARTLLERAMALYPAWSAPLSERAKVYRALGQGGKALADLNAAKKLAPADYWLCLDRATLLVSLGKKDEAYDELTYAISLEPDIYVAYAYRAGILSERGQYDRAEQDYTTLVKLNPQYYFGFEGLGQCKMRASQWTAARDAFLSAYQYAPSEPSYALLAAINWIRAGKLTDPKQFLAQAMRQTDRYAIEWYLLQLFYNLSGDFDILTMVENETNPTAKTKLLYYLGHYYDVRNNKRLANRYFLQVQELGQTSLLEWHLNESVIAERKL